MPNLANQQQNLTYSGLMQIPGGITPALQQVQDGNGNVTGLSLSSAGASVTTSSTFQASKNGTTLTGALPRLISDGFGDLPTVKDFGAVGNGVTDDTAAFTAAIAASPTGVAVPAGSYKITGTVTGAFYSFGGVTVVTGTVTSIQNVLLSYSSSNGSSLIGTIQSGTGAVARTVASKLNDNINVRDFGAVGDGVADDTAAIQAAITAAGSGGTINIPKGTYNVSATLNGLINQQILGSGPNETIIQRTGDYGNTLYFSLAGAAKISGIWFNLTPGYTSGSTTIANNATSGAHLQLDNGQFAVVDDCWFWRMPYGIHINGCTITTIQKCWFQGLWDDNNVGLQEGIANIFLDSSISGNAIININNCYINGWKSALRTITFTASDGTVSVSQSQSIGSKFGILVYACEDLCITNNFIGAHNISGIYALLQPGSTSLDWRIIGNFLDDGSPFEYGANIYFGSAGTAGINGLTITGNVFNNETVGKHAITAYNAASSTSSVITNFTISSNTFQAYVGTPISLYQAVNGVISNNTITGYNCLNTSAGADVTFSAAIILEGIAKYINLCGNNCGGSINTSSVPDYTYLSIVNGATNPGLNIVSANLAVGIGASGSQIGYQEKIPTVLTTTGNYQALPTDEIIISTATRTGTWSIGLPLTPPLGRTITIKDGAGSAGTYSIQIVGTIDGTINPTLTTAYAKAKYLWNGTQWNVIG